MNTYSEPVIVLKKKMIKKSLLTETESPDYKNKFNANIV